MRCFPHMTVENNIAFGLKQDGMPKPQIAERVDQMLKLVKLDKFAKRKPHQLSGGQRQRVALARSLAKRPKVLLLDEPLGALDKKLREETQFELMDLQQQLGLTFVVVTHDQEEAMTMADRIAVMAHGKVDPGGNAAGNLRGAELALRRRLHRRREHFRRHGLRCRPRHGRDCDGSGLQGAPRIRRGACRRHESRACRSPGENPRQPRSSRPARHSMRPKGEIWDIGYLGDMTIFHVRLKDGKVIKASSLNAVRAVEDPLGYDQQVWISFDENAGVVLKD